MSATHYESSSRGTVEIASMQYDHAKNALAVLQRDGGDPEVIAALDAHVKGIEASSEGAANG